MQNDPLTNLLRNWSNDQLPDDDTRHRILRGVLRPRRRPYRRIVVAALSGILAVAATLLFLLTPPQIDDSRQAVDGRRQTADGSREVFAAQPSDANTENIQISLIVLKQLHHSESAVEFLEDTIMVAAGKTLHTLDLGEHQFFLWIYPLEESLFVLDIGIDNAAETGIVAVPDRTELLQFMSNGEMFDVFVSVVSQT